MFPLWRNLVPKTNLEDSPPPARKLIKAIPSQSTVRLVRPADQYCSAQTSQRPQGWLCPLQTKPMKTMNRAIHSIGIFIFNKSICLPITSKYSDEN